MNVLTDEMEIVSMSKDCYNQLNELCVSVISVNHSTMSTAPTELSEIVELSMSNLVFQSRLVKFFLFL